MEGHEVEPTDPNVNSPDFDFVDSFFNNMPPSSGAASVFLDDVPASSSSDLTASSAQSLRQVSPELNLGAASERARAKGDEGSVNGFTHIRSSSSSSRTMWYSTRSLIPPPFDFVVPAVVRRRRSLASPPEPENQCTPQPQSSMSSFNVQRSTPAIPPTNHITIHTRFLIESATLPLGGVPYDRAGYSRANAGPPSGVTGQSQEALAYYDEQYKEKEQEDKENDKDKDA
ncbi:hypothetical protein BDZ97DRAFT_1931113 [Flammula alnicola]|nr:hypothetical protein BDZ97DRAFT_1931113 [Flammula alnicola]